MTLPFCRAAMLSASLALPAVAQEATLECPTLDLPSTWERVAESDTAYRVLLGTVNSRRLIPSPRPTVVEGTFRGRELQADGTFGPATTLPVTLETTCENDVCGVFRTQMPQLAFADVDPDSGALRIEFDACGSWVFLRPDDAMLDMLANCVAGDCGAS